jgi:hypothetical protein
MTPGYREEDGYVVLTMTRHDYEGLLLMLGWAPGTMAREHFGNLRAHIGLVNRLNAGNPNFTPYAAGEEVP